MDIVIWTWVYLGFSQLFSPLVVSLSRTPKAIRFCSCDLPVTLEHHDKKIMLVGRDWNIWMIFPYLGNNHPN